jgi:hypothetical protein
VDIGGSSNNGFWFIIGRVPVKLSAGIYGVLSKSSRNLNFAREWLWVHRNTARCLPTHPSWISVASGVELSCWVYCWRIFVNDSDMPSLQHHCHTLDLRMLLLSAHLVGRVRCAIMLSIPGIKPMAREFPLNGNVRCPFLYPSLKIIHCFLGIQRELQNISDSTARPFHTVLLAKLN